MAFAQDAGVTFILKGTRVRSITGFRAYFEAVKCCVTDFEHVKDRGTDSGGSKPTQFKVVKFQGHKSCSVVGPDIRSIVCSTLNCVYVSGGDKLWATKYRTVVDFYKHLRRIFEWASK